MQVNIQEFLKEANIEESIYPGKMVVKPCQHSGEFKSHCVVLDWRNPEEIVVEIRAGLTGKVVPPENIKKYPVCFQMPTYVKIAVTNDNASDEDDEEEKGRGKQGSASGGGGRKPQKRKLDEMEMIAGKFSNSASGDIPVIGKIKEMMVLGVKIAKEAFKNTFSELTRQISHAKVSATEILAKTGSFVKRVQPPAFVTPKGDETVKYKYDRIKNADIGLKNPSL